MSVWCLALLALVSAPGSFGAAVRTTLTDSDLGRGDDSTYTASLPFAVNILGSTYASGAPYSINTNGNLSFGGVNATYVPILQTTGIATIAPFFADATTTPRNNGSLSRSIGTVSGFAAFGATWENVNYYGNPGNANRNSFQALIISRADTGAGNFDLEFNYDKITWLAGTATAGVVGPVIGVSGAGSGASLALLAGQTTSLLDSSATGLIDLTNVGVDGRVVMQSRGGYLSQALSTAHGNGGALFTITKSGTLADVFDNPLGGTGATAMTLKMAGTTTLTGTNTFSGATTVTNGTLALAATSGQALANTSGVMVNTGGTLLLGKSNQVNDSAALQLGGGTLNTGGFSETLGTLTLSANSTIDFGTVGASVIHFAASQAATWTGTLSIYNWSGANSTTDRLYFGSSNNALTSTQLNQISFFSGSGTGYLGKAMFSNAGELEAAPIPEPSTVLAGLGLVGLVVYRERGRLAGFARKRSDIAS